MIRIKLTRTTNGPVATAYVYQQTVGKSLDTYLVFDIGSGTLDISILEYEDDILEVKIYSGDSFLVEECQWIVISN